MCQLDVISSCWSQTYQPKNSFLFPYFKFVISGFVIPLLKKFLVYGVIDSCTAHNVSESELEWILFNNNLFQVHWFKLGLGLLWMGEPCMLILVKLLYGWCLFQALLPILLTETLLVELSFNSISKEFFLAATVGLFGWIGCSTFPLLDLLEILLFILIFKNFILANHDFSFSLHLKWIYNSPLPLKLRSFWFLTGLALWSDTKVYGYNSPLTSLKELVFGS